MSKQALHGAGGQSDALFRGREKARATDDAIAAGDGRPAGLAD